MLIATKWIIYIARQMLLLMAIKMILYLATQMLQQLLMATKVVGTTIMMTIGHQQVRRRRRFRMRTQIIPTAVKKVKVEVQNFNENSMIQNIPLLSELVLLPVKIKIYLKSRVTPG